MTVNIARTKCGKNNNNNNNNNNSSNGNNTSNIPCSTADWQSLTPRSTSSTQYHSVDSFETTQAIRGVKARMDEVRKDGNGCGDNKDKNDEDSHENDGDVAATSDNGSGLTNISKKDEKK
jgi:hypothetical protein